MGVPNATITLDELERGPTSTANHDLDAKPNNVPQSDYHEKCVKPNLERCPWLNILDEFLDPAKDCFKIKADIRLFGLDVQVIHLSASGVHAVSVCQNVKEFMDAISSQDDERIGTVVIAENLTRETIDVLGMQYQLEPEFVACHLQGTEMFRMGYWEPLTAREPVRAPNILPDGRRKAPYYNIEFRRPYHFPKGLKELFDLRSRITNTPRGAEALGGEIPDMFVFEKVSVYKRQRSNFAVILTDKLLSEAPPASYMLDVINYDGRPDTAATSSRLKQVSCREELVGWLEQLTTQEAKLLFDDHEPLALRPVLKIVERASSIFLAHARFIMSRIVTGHCDSNFPDSIGFFIQVSRALHWHIHDQYRVLKLALRVASLRGEDKLEEPMQDVEFLMEDMADALKSLDEDVRFLVAAASIREGRVVGLVSKFAFVFLPVSLLAAILSISDPGYTRFAIMGCLSVPFVLISTYLMFFWKPSQTDSLRHALVH